MNSPVAVPLWLALALLFFALLGLWLGVAIPVLNRLLYRRRQRAVRRLDEKLEFGLPTYSLASRKDWLDRLLHDREVEATVDALAAETGEPREAVQARALRAAQEIVPFFNVLLYFRVGYWVGRWALRTLYWIRTRYEAEESLAGLSRDCCVVLVSNHRSNLDPFLLLYMASRRSAISYSAGEWALAWPFRYLLHAIGFYIVRREGTGDRLHRTLVQRYVYLSASHCVPQGLFLEGGLSRDGRMQPLKLGMLSYLVKAQGQDLCRDMVFIPVGLNYDRIPEDRTLVAHQDQGFTGKGRMYASLSFLRFLVSILPRMLGLSKPFGTVVANFGCPLSLACWEQQAGRTLADAQGEDRREMIETLGDTLRQRIERLIPVLPISLLAHELLLAGDGGIAQFQLKSRALALGHRLRAAGMPVIIDEGNEERDLTEALYMILKRGYAFLGPGQRLTVPARGKPMLDYYCNSIPGLDALDSISS